MNHSVSAPALLLALPPVLLYCTLSPSFDLTL